MTRSAAGTCTWRAWAASRRDLRPSPGEHRWTLFGRNDTGSEAPGRGDGPHKDGTDGCQLGRPRHREPHGFRVGRAPLRSDWLQGVLPVPGIRLAPSARLNCGYGNITRGGFYRRTRIPSRTPKTSRSAVRRCRLTFFPRYDINWYGLS